VRHRFDRKHLIRTVLNSRVYQASGKKTPTNGDDVKYFSRHVPRRLGAEALLDAISDATSSPERFKGFPVGTRAVQVPDGEFKHPVLGVFGRPPRASACECERDPEFSLYGCVTMLGGDFLQAKLTDPQGAVAKLAASPLSDREVIEELFLRTLCRRPSAKETETLLAYLAKPEKLTRQQKCEDLMYALVNHTEFIFQH
jgi:hypothetical protein